MRPGSAEVMSRTRGTARRVPQDAGSGSVAASLAGRNATRKRAPPPGGLTAVSVPPASAMMLWLMARTRPVPLPGALGRRERVTDDPGARSCFASNPRASAHHKAGHLHGDAKGMHKVHRCAGPSATAQETHQVTHHQPHALSARLDVTEGHAYLGELPAGTLKGRFRGGPPSGRTAPDSPTPALPPPKAPARWR
jgi:hypothetical protein